MCLCSRDVQPSQPELYHPSKFPVFILQEESGDSPGSSSSATMSSSSSSNGSTDSSGRFVAATNVPHPSVEAPGGSSSSSSDADLGTSAHDVRPLHGGAAFYGFPEFGPKPGAIYGRVTALACRVLLTGLWVLGNSQMMQLTVSSLSATQANN